MAALAVLVACTEGGGAPQPVVDVKDRVPGARVDAGYPRIGAVYLAQENLPGPEVLARYDVVVIDNEWAHRVDVSFFDTVRQLNPSITMLTYVSLTDYPVELGTQEYYANRYDLWQYQNGVSSTFPPEWLARTAEEDRPVSEYPNSLMTNLADVAPEVNGQRFLEYGADWVSRRVWSSGVWDGIFLDVWGDRIYSADAEQWNVDGDGEDEPDSEIYGPGNPWERGVAEAERLMRAAMPDAILVANGKRTFRGGQIDGRMWESFADDQEGRDPVGDLRGYVDTTALGDHREPGLTINLDRRRDEMPLTATDARRARFFLTGTLLQNGFWAGAGLDYAELSYYDEFDGGGLGRGYLGVPLVANPTWEDLQAEFRDGVGQVADGVYRRDFAAGIALHNASGERRTVTLERRYRKLDGTQAPAVNNGSLVQRVTLEPEDGLILLRTAG